MHKPILAVTDWLDLQVARQPRKSAVADVQETLTYEELSRRARILGSQVSCPARSAVIICMDKSVNCFAAMLGVLYADCFYSVLDPELPKQRLRCIATQLQALLCFTDRQNKAGAQTVFEALGVRVLCVEELLSSTVSFDEQLLKDRAQRSCDTDPMYCNFTSGSTGQPKGVLISQRSVLDFIPVFCDTMALTQDEIFGNQAPFDFDVSVKDLYSALYLGAEVHLIPRAYFVNPVALMDYLTERQITTLVWAVSALIFVAAMRAFTYRVPAQVRRVIYSGEVLPLQQLKTWHRYLPQAQFTNVYGPTEITCNCTYYHLDEGDFERADLPIGRSFPNERVFLLDEQEQEITAPGFTGEICVAGTCLALGYIGAEGNHAFTPNPLNTLYKEMIYRTGDRGFYDAEGLLHYAGRKDFQIKYLGHRIELLEIERHCGALEQVSRCCCVYQSAKNRLALYYEGEAAEDMVRTALSEALPSFMVPSLIYRLPALPLNPHGKIDRMALQNNPALAEGKVQGDVAP
ncbi:MAG: amino acid adenylation domain-containing protein [Succinivibrio sp.]|nr:amino acid adenylation domain-containing protein [Succinivibrio sp.]